MKNNDIIEQQKCFEELTAISNYKYLYKYLDFAGGVNMLEHHNIQFTRADKLNDKWDCNWEIVGSENNEDVILVLNKHLRYGICSLTTSADNSTLWNDEYAGSQGICIGLNTKILMEYLISNYIAQPPFIVKYVNDIKSHLTSNMLKYGGVDSVTNFFRVKDKHQWQEENEIRFVSLHPLKEEYDRFELPKECFESVHVGKDVTFEQIENIRVLANKVGLNIDIIK